MPAPLTAAVQPHRRLKATLSKRRHDPSTIYWTVGGPSSLIARAAVFARRWTVGLVGARSSSLCPKAQDPPKIRH